MIVHKNCKECVPVCTKVTSSTMLFLLELLSKGSRKNGEGKKMYRKFAQVQCLYVKHYKGTEVSSVSIIKHCA